MRSRTGSIPFRTLIGGESPILAMHAPFLPNYTTQIALLVYSAGRPDATQRFTSLCGVSTTARSVSSHSRSGAVA